MAQTIDPVKLKAAAERLEWVLQQYPDSDDVRGRLHALQPLIHAAMIDGVTSPQRRHDMPGTYAFVDGLYTAFKNPNVENTCVDFSIALRAGLTKQEKALHQQIEVVQKPPQVGGMP